MNEEEEKLIIEHITKARDITLDMQRLIGEMAILIDPFQGDNAKNVLPALEMSIAMFGTEIFSIIKLINGIK